MMFSAVVAEKTSRTPNGEESMSRVLFFEDGSMEQIGIFELDRLEQGISCITCVFQNDAPAAGADANTGDSSASPAAAPTFHSGAPAAVEYFVVGTAHVVNGEAEPSRGRLLVFEIVANRRVHLIAEKEVKGGVFSLAQVSGGRLVAGVGSKVSIYNLMGGKENLSNFTGQPELLHECTHSNQIMSLFLKTKGDNILVGDLVRSMTLLRYKPHEHAIQEIARDFNSSYLRGVEILDGASEDIFVGTDISGNLHCLRQQSDALTDEERSRLEPCGEFHVGDYLNAFRRGSLVGQPIDVDAPQSAKGPAETCSSILGNNYQSITGLKVGTSCVLYGGVSGSIGNVIALSEDSYRFFASVERVMKRVVMPMGGLNHRDWRSFQNDLRVAPQRNMVDGDLVEMLLEFDRQQLEQVAREINDELNLVIAAANATGPAKSSSIVSSPLSTIPTGQMLLNMERDKLQLSVEDIMHRIEDMSRLH